MTGVTRILSPLEQGDTRAAASLRPLAARVIMDLEYRTVGCMQKQLVWLAAVVVGGSITKSAFADLPLNLGPDQFVQADGSDIDLVGWSVPSFARWDGDDRPDLIVGHEDAAVGKVSVYLNTGTATTPVFEDSFFVQSVGADLAVPDAGCMDAFPRVVYWDADPRKDLLMGLADGTVRIYLNTDSDAAPMFDGGSNLQVGPASGKLDIDVGSRATSVVTDWNSDGRKDLVVGALDGRIRVFLNEGTDTAPDFVSEFYAEADGSALTVPSGRASPVVLDLDGDGKKDILTGNTAGQLLLYSNVGTDAEPRFSSFQYVQADGVNIDLPSAPRSRPSIADWNADGRWDVLIGDATGKVHLFIAVSEPLLTDFDGDEIGRAHV